MIDHMAAKNINRERMVEVMGGKILITPAQQMLIDSWNKGKAEGKAESVMMRLDMLGETDDDLRNRIMSETRIDILEGWRSKAWGSKSIEKFVASMDEDLVMV